MAKSKAGGPKAAPKKATKKAEPAPPGPTIETLCNDLQRAGQMIGDLQGRLDDVEKVTNELTGRLQDAERLGESLAAKVTELLADRQTGGNLPPVTLAEVPPVQAPEGDQDTNLPQNA